MDRHWTFSVVVLALAAACGLDEGVDVAARPHELPGLSPEPSDEAVVAADDWLGVVVASRAVEVRAPTDATITSLTVDVGQHVGLGDLLVQLDLASATEDQRLRDALAESAKARAREADVERKGAENERDRVRRLHAEGHASRSDLEIAEQAVAAAEATHARTRADVRSRDVEVTRARRRRLERRVVAPFSGVVARRHVAAGDVVREGGALLRLLETRAPRVAFAVDRDAAGARPQAGDPVIVSTPDGSRVWSATVDAVHPDADLRTGLQKFEAALDCPVAKLCPHGTPVVVRPHRGS